MDNMHLFYTKDGEEAMIRPAFPGDARGFIYTLDSVCREGIYMLHETAPRTVEEQEHLIRVVDYRKNLIAVVEVRNSIVGGIGIFTGGISPKTAHFCNIGLHLIKQVREKGIGDRMMKYSIDWARKRGFQKMCLSVFSSNKRAIHLYRKNGFVIEGIRKRQFIIGSEYVDEVLMARFLTE